MDVVELVRFLRHHRAAYKLNVPSFKDTFWSDPQIVCPPSPVLYVRPFKLDLTIEDAQRLLAHPGLWEAGNHE